MDILIREMFKQNLRKSFQHFGIEGTEDKIKELWINHPEIIKQYLEVYRELITGRKRYLNYRYKDLTK